jgi:hypothetical protein
MEAYDQEFATLAYPATITMNITNQKAPLRVRLACKLLGINDEQMREEPNKERN